VTDVEEKTARAIAKGRALVTEIMKGAPETHDPFTDPDDDTRREDEPGPWFIAGFDDVCSRGGEPIDSGDTIRADGDGGWECRGCVDADQVANQGPWVCTIAPGHRCRVGHELIPAGSLARFDGDGWECRLHVLDPGAAA
jgi:hypothetical protein